MDNDLKVFGIYFNKNDPTHIQISFKDDDAYDIVGYRYTYFYRDGKWTCHVPKIMSEWVHPLEIVGINRQRYIDNGEIVIVSNGKDHCIFDGDSWRDCHPR